MKQFLRFCSGCILLVGVLGSCQPDGTTEEVGVTHYAYLDVRYLAPEQSLRGQAIFTQGDSVLSAQPLVVPGGASFMGSGMKKKNLYDDRIRYETTLKTAYVDSLRFRYRAQEDEPWQETSLSMSPVRGFRVVSASKQNGISVAVDASVDLTERLVLLFTDPNGEARTVVRLGPLSDKTIFIPADGLDNYLAGPYSLYIVKIKEGEFTQGKWLVNEHLEYYTAAQSFTLAE
ncbi:MAG: hypothetical protein D6772_00045 [Bacteroidetes bacterium]|nr:MAG: hypothetical protein D6772_00045 [Bacteroidota bacterium]